MNILKYLFLQHTGNTFALSVALLVIVIASALIWVMEGDNYEAPKPVTTTGGWIVNVGLYAALILGAIGVVGCIVGGFIRLWNLL